MPELKVTKAVLAVIRSGARRGLSHGEIVALVERRCSVTIDRRTVRRWTSAPDDAPTRASEPRSAEARAKWPTVEAEAPIGTELEELTRSALCLRAALLDPGVASSDLVALSSELRKTLAAIRNARLVGTHEDSDLVARAAAIRDRLAAMLPPSPPPHLATVPSGVAAAGGMH